MNFSASTAFINYLQYEGLGGGGAESEWPPCCKTTANQEKSWSIELNRFYWKKLLTVLIKPNSQLPLLGAGTLSSVPFLRVLVMDCAPQPHGWGGGDSLDSQDLQTPGSVCVGGGDFTGLLSLLQGGVGLETVTEGRKLDLGWDEVISLRVAWQQGRWDVTLAHDIKSKHDSCTHYVNVVKDAFFFLTRWHFQIKQGVFTQLFSDDFCSVVDLEEIFLYHLLTVAPRFMLCAYASNATFANDGSAHVLSRFAVIICFHTKNQVCCYVFH